MNDTQLRALIAAIFIVSDKSGLANEYSTAVKKADDLLNANQERSARPTGGAK
jgi:hypothetical protein